MSAQDITTDWAASSDDEAMAAVKAGSADAFAVLHDRLGLQRLRGDIHR